MSNVPTTFRRNAVYSIGNLRRKFRTALVSFANSSSNWIRNLKNIDGWCWMLSIDFRFLRN